MDREFMGEIVRLGMTDKELIDLLSNVLIKSMHRSKHLTEGDVAFQDLGLENKDVVGESSMPIDVDKTMSTMSPKVVIGETEDHIEGDKQGLTFKKDYSTVPGVTSTQHQVTGEEANVIGYPEKVDAVEDIKRRTNVSENKDSHFEKIYSCDSDEEFWNAVDDMIIEDDVINVHKGYVNGEFNVKHLVDNLGEYIHSTLKKSVNLWFIDINKTEDFDDIAVSLKKNLIKWNKNISNEVIKDFSTLINLGIKVGIRKSRIPASQDFYNHTSSLLLNDEMVKSIMREFTNERYDIILSIIKSNSLENYQTKKAIDIELKNTKAIIKDMIKNEVEARGNSVLTAVLNRNIGPNNE